MSCVSTTDRISSYSLEGNKNAGQIGENWKVKQKINKKPSEVSVHGAVNIFLSMSFNQKMRCTSMITIIKGTIKILIYAIAPTELICQHVNIQMYYIEMHGN